MRLIDADALKYGLIDYQQKHTDSLGDDYWIVENVLLLIEEIPTIDAEPVRHGHWDDKRVAFFRKCSECGATVKANLADVFLDCDIRDLHFCPNCGAKMDEVEE